MRPGQIVVSLLISCAFAFAVKSGFVPLPDQIVKTGLFGGGSSNWTSVDMRGGNSGAVNMR